MAFRYASVVVVDVTLAASRKNGKKIVPIPLIPETALEIASCVASDVGTVVSSLDALGATVVMDTPVVTTSPSTLNLAISSVLPAVPVMKVASEPEAELVMAGVTPVIVLDPATIVLFVRVSVVPASILSVLKESLFVLMSAIT